jgi:sulfonate transport system substrate-binding protein
MAFSLFIFFIRCEPECWLTRVRHENPMPQLLKTRSPLGRRTLRGFVAASLFTLAACSGAASENKPDALRFGDQMNAVETLLKFSGEDANTAYRLNFANFTSGPPIIAAQTGGSLDLGYMAETPLVFAQAAGSPVKIVAVLSSSNNDGSPYALVVRPDSSIQSPADLKGKAVAYQKGTVVHYLVARALDQAGLKLSDIKTVQANGLGASLLDNGAADAVTLGEPILTRQLDKGSVRVIATGARPTTPGFFYLVASEEALADPARSKAIGDLIGRIVRAEKWRQNNIEASAPALAAHYKVDEELAKKIIRRNPQSYVPIDADVIQAHQAEADLFFEQGYVRKKLDARQIFDDRYNDIVSAAAGAVG